MTLRFEPRPDAMDKLQGKLVYLADRVPPNCLAGAILRSPHPHAMIRAIDIAAAIALPGVHAVITADHLPQGLRNGIHIKDQPILALERVRHVGEPVAAVAADTPSLARAALAAIRVDYCVLPVVDDPETALGADAPRLHANGNLCHHTVFARGSLDEAFARAVHVVEMTLETPRQIHAALELEGGIAIPDGAGRLTILAASQHPHGARGIVAAALGWSQDRIDIVGSPLGGGFGGKEDIHVQPIIALLAVQSGRPVRIVLTRGESIDAGFKRHVFRIRMRTGCNAAGRLLAHEVNLLADTGAYASHGPQVLDTAHECAAGPYDFEAVEVKGRLAYTNNGISGAFRGFGALQVQVALELQIDRLARLAAIDPMALRIANLRPEGAPGSLGQTVYPQPELVTVADRLAKHPLRQRLAGTDPRFLSGTGVALVSKGEGFAAGGPNGAKGQLALSADGILELRSGLAEMGQGLGAAAATLLAKHLGVAASDVRSCLGDTRTSRDSGPTAASRGTQIASRLIRAGVPGLKGRMIAAAAAALDVSPDDLQIGPGGAYVTARRANRPALTFREIAAGRDLVVDVAVPAIEAIVPGGAGHALFTACGAIARVSVDRWTGRVTAEHLLVVPACGPVLVPEAFLGQIEGAASMAIGFALTETLPAHEGRFAARNLDQYLVPTIRDMPVIEVDPVEELDPDDPVDMRGVGEIAINAVGPAIANAVLDALGVPPLTLPIDPAWVLKILREGERPS